MAMTWIMDDTFIAVQNKAGMLMIFSCAGELVWMQKDDSRDIALTLQPLIALRSVSHPPHNPRAC